MWEKVVSGDFGVKPSETQAKMFKIKTATLVQDKNEKLSCRREAARCVISRDVSLSHSR